MPSTYSTYGLELMATGEKNNAWGDITNANLRLLEDAAVGVAYVTMGNADTTLTMPQGTSAASRSFILRVITSTALTQSRNLIVPAGAPKPYVISNETSGSFPITVKGISDVGVPVANGKMSFLFSTGTSVIEVNQQTNPFRVFAGVGDGITDNASLLLAQLCAVAPSGDILYIPPGTYRLLSTVTIPASVGGITMSPGASFRIGHAGIGLDTANAAIRRERQYFHGIDVVASAQSNWLSEDSIGFRAANFFESYIYVRRAQGFTIGFQAFGNNIGWSYNDVFLGRLLNNKISVDVKTSGASSWANENTFYNGRYTVNPSVNGGIDRYGIRFAAEPGAYILHNNNNFIKPSFELDASISAKAYAVYDTVNGQNNFVWRARLEDQSDTVVYTQGGGFNNIFEIGYNGVGSDVHVTSPSTSAIGWTLVDDGLDGPANRSNKVVAFVGDIGNKVFQSGSDYGIRGLNVFSGGSKTAGTSIGAHAAGATTVVSLGTDCAILGSSRAAGLYVNTASVKDFFLTWDSGGSTGRPAVWCYDANNLLLDTSATPVRLSRGQLQYATAGAYWWGTADSSDANSNNTAMLRIPEVAQNAFIGVLRGSANVSLRSFSLTTPKNKAPVARAIVNTENNSVFSQEYDSGLIAVSIGAQVSLTHGLSRMPTFVAAEYQCLTSDGGWSPGQVWQHGADFLYDGAASRMTFLAKSSVGIQVQFNSTQFYIPTYSTGNLQAGSASAWNIRIRAWA